MLIQKIYRYDIIILYVLFLNRTTLGKNTLIAPCKIGENVRSWSNNGDNLDFNIEVEGIIVW